MNHIYRTVFNEQTQTCQAVSENTKTHASCGEVGSTPKNQKNQRVVNSSYFAVHSCFAPKLRLISALIMAFSGSLLCAAPQGGQVRAGQAQITQQGKVTNINQSSQKAAINWQKFNIAADETVNFKQPNAHSVTLNRVIGNEKSVINGAMNANGKVFLLNPHGTLIGKGAKINVGGLVASTANISDDDFMQGKYRFTGNGSGAVENYGEIAVPAGGVVALLAPIVKNNGNIKADSASVLLASAEHFSITLPENGDFAYTIDKGTLQGLVDNGGAVLADGGVVVLTAAGLDSVKKSVVRHTGIIQANTVANKNGKILLLGDLDNSRTEVSGSLKAEAPISGDGGFIETSANKVKIDDQAFISTKATNGKTGEWLIDPTDYTVAASGGDITGQAVSNALQNNNLTLKSTNGKADGKGDVIINDTINWNKNTLILNAQNDIHINKTINGSGSAKLALQYGQANADGGESNYYLDKDVRVNLPAGQNFSTQKGSKGEVVEFEVIHKMPEIIKNNDGKYFSQFPTHKIAIGKDMDLSYTKNYQGFEGWEIYGTNSSPTVFTGLGHQLNNLYINATTDNSVGNNVGFIRYAGESFEVDNIHLRNVDISGEHRTVGGLIASNNTGTVGGQTVNGTGKIRNSSVTGKVSGDYKVGGLIGSSDNTTIKDSWTDTKVTGLNNDVGGLVGYAKDNNILNSYATGDVTGVSDVGGLIGDADGSTSISNSYATGNVIGSEVVGGLVALASGNNISISDSYATGNVVGSETVGGLVGVLAGVKDFDENDEPIKSDTPANISNSYATGKVEGERDVGGLVGETWNAQISKSHATGNVQASGTQSHSNGNVVISSAGGLVGEIEDTKVTQSYATGAVSGVRGLGGLTGYAKNSTISQSYSSSNVTGEERIGGLVGEAQNITIENSYAAGTLTEQSSGTPNVTGYNGEKLAFVGGLVGAVAEYHDGESNTATTTKVKNSYFSGSLNTVPSSSAHGAVIGGNIDPNTQFVAENVYYDDKGGEQDGGAANGIDYGTPLTPAKMKQQSSFKGFDFNSIWEIKEGQSTPTLRQSVLAQMLLKVYATNAHNPYQGSNLIGPYGTYAPNNGYRLELDGQEKSNDWIINNSDITGTLTFGGTWTNAVNAGDYTVIPQGLSSNKYTIEYVPGTFTIDPYAISITGNSVYSGGSTVSLGNSKVNSVSSMHGLYDEINQLKVSGAGKVGVYLPNGQFFERVNAGNNANGTPYALSFDGTNVYVKNADGSTNNNFTINGKDSRWTITPKEVTLTGSVKKSSIANGFTIHDAVSNELNGLLAKDKGQLTVTGKGYLNNNGTLNNKTTFKLNGDSANNYSLKYGQWTIIDDSSQGGSGGSTGGSIGGSTGGSGSGAGTGGAAGGNGGNASGAGTGGSTGGNSGSVKPNKPTQTQTTPNPTTQVNNENTNGKITEQNGKVEHNTVGNPTVDYDNGSGTVSSGSTTSGNGSSSVNCSGNSCAPYAYDPSKVDLTSAFAVSEEEEPAKKPYWVEQQTKPQGGNDGGGQTGSNQQAEQSPVVAITPEDIRRLKQSITDDQDIFQDMLLAIDSGVTFNVDILNRSTELSMFDGFGSMDVVTSYKDMMIDSLKKAFSNLENVNQDNIQHNIAIDAWLQCPTIDFDSYPYSTSDDWYRKQWGFTENQWQQIKAFEQKRTGFDAVDMDTFIKHFGSSDVAFLSNVIYFYANETNMVYHGRDNDVKGAQKIQQVLDLIQKPFEVLDIVSKTKEKLETMFSGSFSFSSPLNKAKKLLDVMGNAASNTKEIKKLSDFDNVVDKLSSWENKILDKAESATDMRTLKIELKNATYDGSLWKNQSEFSKIIDDVISKSHAGNALDLVNEVLQNIEMMKLGVVQEKSNRITQEFLKNASAEDTTLYLAQTKVLTHIKTTKGKTLYQIKKNSLKKGTL